MKIQKPTEYDIHLQYRCPGCCNIHWLSFLESSTKNFKVVCDCGCVFKVKRTTGFKLRYTTKPKSIQQKESKTPQSTIPEDLLNRAIEALLPYGFTKNESKELLSKAYSNKQTKDIGLLIKNTLEILRNEHCTTI
jgi:hypothetical protein